MSNSMKTIFTVFSSVVILLSASAVSLACACCAEHGSRYAGSGPVDQSRIELLKEMNFDDAAVLFTDEGGFEGIRGLNAIKSEWDNGSLEKISLIDAFTGNVWKLTLKTPGGKTAALTLPRPTRMTFLKVDQHEVEVGAGEAVLYKEFSFSGRVGGATGFLTSSRAAAYTLIFQGKGNMCDNAQDFNHWRLEVKGSGADYAFFGKMAS